MAGAIALGVARWLEKSCCVLRCALIVAYVVTRSMHPTVFIFCTVLHDVYIYLFTKVYSELPRSRDDACLGGGYFYQVL